MFIEPLPEFKPCKRGDFGSNVKRVQEWLNFHGFRCAIDGDFGPITEEQVFRSFYQSYRPPFVVDNDVIRRLEAPLYNACKNPIWLHRSQTTLGAANVTFGDVVTAFARQHITAGPREIGGPNMGPWVRLYMLDREGPKWPWCAGFAFYILRQAAMFMNVNLPIRPAFGCYTIADDAKVRGRYIDGSTVTNKNLIRPGYLFIVRDKIGKLIHTGLVKAVYPDHIDTFEGNTNDEGHRDGYEACIRARAYTRLDFINTYPDGL